MITLNSIAKIPGLTVRQRRITICPG